MFALFQINACSTLIRMQCVHTHTRSFDEIRCRFYVYLFFGISHLFAIVLLLAYLHFAHYVCVCMCAKHAKNIHKIDVRRRKMGKVVRYSRRGMKKRETQCLKKSKCRESWSRCEYVYRDTCTVHLVYLCVIWRNTDWVKQISVDHIQIRMKCVRWHLRSRSRYTHTRQYSTIAYKNPPIQSVRAVCVCVQVILCGALFRSFI